MTASSDRLLRRTLWGNAVFLRRSPAPCWRPLPGPSPRLAAHAPVSVLGLDLAIVLELLGVGVDRLRRAVRLGRFAERRCRRAWARFIFAADIAWVAASVAGAGPAGRRGPWPASSAIVVVALIVADFVILEYLGLRKMSAATQGGLIPGGASAHSHAPWGSVSKAVTIS